MPLFVRVCICIHYFVCVKGFCFYTGLTNRISLSDLRGRLTSWTLLITEKPRSCCQILTKLRSC